MDARPKTRQVSRERTTPSPQVPRGAKQIVIPMTQQQYDDIWHDADRVRSFIEQCVRSAPELFPAGFDQGHCLHGFGRESLKLSGLKLRKIVLANDASYWLRPSFIFSSMTGTVDELAYPLLLARHGVPFWLLTLGFGHNDMFWYRLTERLGRHSVVGTTVHDPAQLPSHLAADEHHADWAGQKGYVATTVGEGCILGVGLTASADDAHLEQAYGVFAAEARDVNPEYAPETVNTDGWAAMRNAFQTLFPLIAVVLCFLHGFLKIRDRCRKARELHRRVWDVYRGHRGGVSTPDERASTVVWHPTPMVNLGRLCLELLSGKGLESALLEEIDLKHETVYCHHGVVLPKPPWIQGRSHGCTVFGFLLAGICQTGTTASKAF